MLVVCLWLTHSFVHGLIVTIIIDLDHDVHLLFHDSGFLYKALQNILDHPTFQTKSPTAVNARIGADHGFVIAKLMLIYRSSCKIY